MTRRPAPDLDLVQRLRSAGLQPTRQRLAVAAVMFAQPVHLTAEQVVKTLHGGAPTVADVDATPISRATVYATLAQFAAAGLLRELHSGTGAAVDDRWTWTPARCTTCRPVCVFRCRASTPCPPACRCRTCS